jgi:two-component sensor histidine kinase
VVLVDNELRALRHRIKNDLQLVGSLIRLELSETRDATAKRALETIDRRVLAITLSYVSDVDGTLPLRGYLEELCRSLPDVAFSCNDERTLSTTSITRLGIIVAEVCGTSGHGTDLSVTGEGAKVRIDARRRGSETSAWLTGFSHELVKSLARQLRGTFEEPDANRVVVTVEP